MSYSSSNLQTKPQESELDDVQRLTKEIDESQQRLTKKIDEGQQRLAKLTDDTERLAKESEDFKELFRVRVTKFDSTGLNPKVFEESQGGAKAKDHRDSKSEENNNTAPAPERKGRLSLMRPRKQATSEFLTGLSPQDFDPRPFRIRPADLQLKEYDDNDLDSAQTQEEYAKGKVNTLSKLVYKNSKIGVFKPEILVDRSGAKAFDLCGIKQDDPRFGNRNIASRVMSDVLGSKLIPKSRFTIHKGQLGLLMDMAPGVKVRDLKGSDLPTSDEAMASLQQQLNELEWIDMLTGQVDRHDENYMIDITDGSVKITGIDNDLCFGENQGKFGEYSGIPIMYLSAQKPPLMDKAAFEKLTKLDFEKDVRPQLDGLLTIAEIEATASRIAEMKQHAESLAPDFIVEDWQTWRSPKTTVDPGGKSAPEFLAATEGTLFNRDFVDKSASKKE
jgi:hypothetical protein